MKWIEVKIKTTTEAVEVVSNILYDVGVGGVVIEDSNDLILQDKDLGNWDYIDESLLENKFDGAIVKGYLPEGEDLLDKLGFIKDSVEKIPLYNLDKGLGEVTTSEMFEEDWEDAWKQYYKPKKIGEKIVIKPTWENYEASSDEIILELDPGMAFGTGTHETTMMCVQQLERYVNDRSIVFDIGCGSGILSIAAAKLGAYKVIGVDMDNVAAKVSKKNVEENRVEDRVDIRKGNLMEVVNGKATIIVANIIADIIKLLAADVPEYLEKNGIFIASGIILEKIDEVKTSLENHGFHIMETIIMGEWAAIISTLKDEKINA